MFLWMIVGIERTNTLCIIKAVVSEEKDGGRRETPAFVNIVKIFFNIGNVDKSLL